MEINTPLDDRWSLAGMIWLDDAVPVLLVSFQDNRASVDIKMARLDMTKGAFIDKTPLPVDPGIISEMVSKAREALKGDAA